MVLGKFHTRSKVKRHGSGNRKVRQVPLTPPGEIRSKVEEGEYPAFWSKNDGKGETSDFSKHSFSPTPQESGLND